MAGLVVSALTGVMNPLLNKLTTMVGMEFKLLQGVGSQVTFLKEELRSMSAFLVKLASMEEEVDPQTKEWMGMVRELTYDIEDCIDQFMLHCGDKDKSKISMVRERHKIANLVQQLKARAMEASQRHERYKLDHGDGEAQVRVGSSTSSMVEVDPRLPALYVGADRLVGIDGPREEIIELLMGDDKAAAGDRRAKRQPPKVVSILGFGGLGKTTLAIQVYSKIKWQFNCAAFVSVSRNPNTKKILTDMLRQVGGNVGLPTDTERQLIEHLRLHLGDKRYLIVIDDIWSVQAWEVVKCALPDNKYNSKIMTTTRIVDVAKSCCPCRHDHVFQIGPLSDEDSQRLFLRRIFGSEHSCPPQLKEISTGILKRCGGMPLAIISIASMLASKPHTNTKEQWERAHCIAGAVTARLAGRRYRTPGRLAGGLPGPSLAFAAASTRPCGFRAAHRRLSAAAVSSPAPLHRCRHRRSCLRLCSAPGKQ
ncbi:disease resistance protein RGA5-like, partial [Miscanthus floridulus]|uniref:disease resistance protein RGA5-like n=1 Tax=Miscanthus floridulus TaxID=154761 RepID=UPI00345A2407